MVEGQNWKIKKLPTQNRQRQILFTLTTLQRVWFPFSKFFSEGCFTWLPSDPEASLCDCVPVEIEKRILEEFLLLFLVGVLFLFYSVRFDLSWCVIFTRRNCRTAFFEDNMRKETECIFINFLLNIILKLVYLNMRTWEGGDFSIYVSRIPSKCRANREENFAHNEKWILATCV